MPRAKKRWDVIEIHAERGITYLICGVGILLFNWLLWAFRGEGMFLPLIIVLGVIGGGFVGMAVYKAIEIKRVTQFLVTCPLCDFVNELTAAPGADFVCGGCTRLVPIQDGDVMEAKTVKCPTCGDINFYSEKTEFLICEGCNHQIPIDTDASRAAGNTVRAAQHFAVVDDTNVYEFILVAHGHKTEELIEALQHMLALNRNQVKQMLNELPVTLLTGITRRKAEMLQAQLSLHDAATEYRPMQPV